MSFTRNLIVGLMLAGSLSLSAQAQDAPLPPEEAARTMVVPEGFQVTLFAGEPDVVQPIAMATDDRGRLWVVECLSYPEWKADGTGSDRVVIFEDADNDGRFDSRKVFFDAGVNLSGIELGFGGVWLCSTPHLVFVPDRDRDDAPDGPAEVVLDGWDVTARHNAFNGLTWGPDGWLYGCNGILSNSRVGAPGTPDEERVALNCGVWRYHPTRKEFEAVAHGTTNPWGVDFDEWGQAFITNCVIKHLFHIVPGAHYERMFGQDINPYSFGLLTSCADHIHWAGGYWDTEGVDKPTNDAFGGGHAHCGTLIYVGDNWPAEYRNTLLTSNIHGRRVNNDVLEQHDSGYVAHHGADVIRSADPFFRGVALHMGPDGGVYLADWSDTGECHDYEEVQRQNGRIFKITYGQPEKPVRDVAALGASGLIKAQKGADVWLARHARRVLQEQAAAEDLGHCVPTALANHLFQQDLPAERRLQFLWALHAVGGRDEKRSLRLMADDSENLRGWAVRLELEDRTASQPVLDRLAEMAASDPSPRVRLELAAGLQRLPVNQRRPIAVALAAHAEDAADANLPLMAWYGVEPLVAEDKCAALALLTRAELPLVREYTARRLALADDLQHVFAAVAGTNDPMRQRDALRGAYQALEGRRDAVPPDDWTSAAAAFVDSSDAEVRETALALGVLYGDASAVERLRTVAIDAQLDSDARQRALAVLVRQRVVGLAPTLQVLLDDADHRAAAIRGLASYDDEATPAALLARYASLDDAGRADVIATLSVRPEYAMTLLAAIAEGHVPRTDVSPFAARQLLALGDAGVTEKLTAVWGAIRPAAEGKAERIAHYKGLLAPDNVQGADLSRGRQIFTKQCGACHRLFEAGGRIGPELTGAQRMNLDYVLENLLDPSAVVPRDYQVSTFEMDDGRVVTGIVLRETDDAATVQTQNDQVVLPKGEVVERQPSPLSMMPEGILANLSDEEVRDLVAYLASPTPPAE